VPQGDVQAYKWFNPAAGCFAASEEELRDTASKKRDLEAAKTAPARTAEAQKPAHQWMPG